MESEIFVFNEFTNQSTKILTKENQTLYKKKSHETLKMDNIYLLGRLAEYKYYNLDNIVESSMNLFNERLLNG